MTSALRARLIFVAAAALLALGRAPVQAQTSPGVPTNGIPADASSSSVRLGSVGVHTLVNPGNENADGSVSGGTMGVGARVGSPDGGGTGGGAAGVTTLPPGPPPCDPGELSLNETIPLPNFGIVTDPPQVNQNVVIGVPTWFWTAPYQGGYIKARPLSGRVHVCPPGEPGGHDQPITLYVDIWPDSAQWNWGDGTPIDTEDCGPESGPGVCQPHALGEDKSDDVQHTYFESASDVRVSLKIHFLARIYATGDMSDQAPLPDFYETAQTHLRVNQVQSILVPVSSP